MFEKMKKDALIQEALRREGPHGESLIKNKTEGKKLGKPELLSRVQAHQAELDSRAAMRAEATSDGFKADVEVKLKRSDAPSGAAKVNVVLSKATPALSPMRYPRSHKTPESKARNKRKHRASLRRRNHHRPAYAS